MSIRNAITYASLSLAFIAPAFAADIIVETMPPAAQVETVPAARTGYVWATGYHKWENGQYVWVPGRWVEAQVHSRWVPDTWQKIDDRRWRFVAGHWESSN